MARLKLKSVKGSILEPMIALVIILFAITAAFTVVVQANQTQNMPLEIRAQQVAGRILLETIGKKLFVSEEIEENGLTITKDIKREKGAEHLVNISIIVSDHHGKSLTQRQKLIIQYEK